MCPQAVYQNVCCCHCSLPGEQTSVERRGVWGCPHPALLAELLERGTSILATFSWSGVMKTLSTAMPRWKMAEVRAGLWTGVLYTRICTCLYSWSTQLWEHAGLPLCWICPGTAFTSLEMHMAPNDWQNRVAHPGSPPKAAMFLCTQRRAATWSSNAQFQRAWLGARGSGSGSAAPTVWVLRVCSFQVQSRATLSFRDLVLGPCLLP